MLYTFDGTNRRIILGEAGSLDVRDLLSRWVDWVVQSDNIKFLPAFDQVGGNDIDVQAGTKIPIYAYLINGWRIKPHEVDHTLPVTGGVLLVAGGGDPFINTTGDFTVRINYQQPVQAITINSGAAVAGGLTPTQESMLRDLWHVHGLDSSSPLVVSPSSRISGQIVQSISELPGDTVVVTRA